MCGICLSQFVHEEILISLPCKARNGPQADKDKVEEQKNDEDKKEVEDPEIGLPEGSVNSQTHTFHHQCIE